MTEQSDTPNYGGPCQNTDRELWREREGDYYADSIHVTETGGIGMNCGGYVVVQPIRKWHGTASELADANATIDGLRELLKHQSADVIERLRSQIAERDGTIERLREALRITRGQWIHSANADRCLSALAALEQEDGT